jgi:DNA-binding response OmpR family regulator
VYDAGAARSTGGIPGETIEKEGLTMKILVAESNSSWCRFFQKTLRKWGHDVVLSTDGNQAWETLQQANAPQLAILEWEVPWLEGIDICRRVR